MQTRVAVMSAIVENTDSVEKLNELLHQYGEFIIGRMGLPYKTRKINIVSIAAGVYLLLGKDIALAAAV